MRNTLDSLVTDESPMVRRAVAAAIPDLVRVMAPDYLMSVLVNLFKKLQQDDQESVRVVAVENAVYIAKALQQTGIDDANHQHVVPVIRSAVVDRSWRVKMAIAKDYTELSLAVLGDRGQRSNDILSLDLLPSFIALLQDNEGEVRTAACKNFASYCDVVGPTVFSQHLIPAAHALAPDTVPSVRLALSSACMDLAPKLGQDLFVRNLVPLLERFLSDPSVPDTKVGVRGMLRVCLLGDADDVLFLL